MENINNLLLISIITVPFIWIRFSLGFLWIDRSSEAITI